MPFDASGNFTRLRGNSSWAGDASAHTPIKSDLHDSNDNDLAQGLSNCITKTGATQPTADIPLAGHRLINVGAPLNPGDAVTKAYVDSLSQFSTSLNLIGADLNGRINFTAGTGVQGIGWTGADVAWIARLAVANQMRNQLVLNDKVDGTGTDTFRIDEGGVAYGPWLASPNTEYDGTAWRTIAPGVAALAGFGPTAQAFTLYGLDTATTTAHQTAAIRSHSTFSGGGGNCIWSMYKSSAAGVATYIQAYKGTLARWQIVLANGAAESGSNAGSDFSIGRFNDAGAYLGTPFQIVRSTGAVYCNSGINVTGSCNVNGTGNFAGGMLVSGGDLNVQAGSSYLGQGFWGRGGTTGGYYSYRHNFGWTGGNTLYAYVEGTAWSIAMTPCDYRLKNNVAPLTSQWDAVKALKPISFTFRERELVPADGKEHWGFLAHEVQEALLPTAATTAKDGEMMQALDLIPVVAALTTALQEAMLRIEALEARPA